MEIEEQRTSKPWKTGVFSFTTGARVTLRVFFLTQRRHGRNRRERYDVTPLFNWILGCS